VAQLLAALIPVSNMRHIALYFTLILVPKPPLKTKEKRGNMHQKHTRI